jgi:thioredoxin reductase (NADPH)
MGGSISCMCDKNPLVIHKGVNVPQDPQNDKLINSQATTYVKNSNSNFQKSHYQYDLFVIGGGSGGLSASKEAAQLGAKVGLADFVKPSLQGTSWDLGGTCVNVGCIPKKMMHFAGNLYENLNNYPLVGHSNNISKQHDWTKMVSKIQMYIKKLNFGYKTSLRNEHVTYYNKLAKLVDSHTIELTDSKGKIEIVTSDKILIAVGGRPNNGDIPGSHEHCITSDDIFSLKKSPGKILVIGGSYIALECGGFLNALGYDTTIMVRSILLRGFDQGMAGRLGEYMKNHGIKFLKECTPVRISKNESNNKLIVEIKNHQENRIFSDEYDTCLMAIGRTADTQKLGLDTLGVKLSKSGKIIVSQDEQSSVENIYAIGDCAEGRPELTPPAIMAGKLLSKRIFGNQKKLMDYENIATTVFTPLEYGSVGSSEENAIEKYGKENILVYHSEFKPLEWNFDLERKDTCYVKVIVLKMNNQVIGFHILSPNAGEITQGIGVAIKCGLTKEQLDETVGIHPTIAEVRKNMRFLFKNIF